MEVYGCQLLYQFLIYGLATLVTRCIRVCPLTSFVNCKLSIFFFPFFFFFNACFELFFVCVCVCVFLSYCNLWASLVAQQVDNPPAMQETLFNSWVWKIACTRDRLPISVFLGFPHGSDGKKKSSCNAGEYVSESHSVMSNSL